MTTLVPVGRYTDAVVFQPTSNTPVSVLVFNTAGNVAENAGLPTLGAGSPDAQIPTVNNAGTALTRSGYTVASLLAAARDRATHTGTQVAATISDFAAAVTALLTWGAITGKPSTFTPSTHASTHGAGGSDPITPAAIGSDAAGTPRPPTVHGHTTGDISGFAADSRAQTEAMVVAGANVSVTASGSGASRQITIAAAGGSPGGSSGQPQFNSGGSFAGMTGVSWDNAARALSLDGGTRTANGRALTVTETWNNAGTTFTGPVINIIDNASNAASILFQIQRSGNPAFTMSKDTISCYGSNIAYSRTVGCYATAFFMLDVADAQLWFSMGSGPHASLRSDGTTAAVNGIIAQRFGAQPQSMRWYRTWISDSNYARVFLDNSSATASRFAVESAGASAGNIALELQASGTAPVRSLNPFQVPSFTVATVPSASLHSRALIYVSDESGGAVLAFSDNVNWRRVTDRAIIS